VSIGSVCQLDLFVNWILHATLLCVSTTCQLQKASLLKIGAVCPGTDCILHTHTHTHAHTHAHTHTHLAGVLRVDDVGAAC